MILPDVQGLPAPGYLCNASNSHSLQWSMAICMLYLTLYLQG